MIWTFLRESMSDWKSSVISYKNETLTYEQALKQVELLSAELKNRNPDRLKCAVLCEREINTALSILTCLCADYIPIPMSQNYGEAHNRDIVELTKPDLFITDNPDHEWLIKWQRPSFNILNGQWMGHVTERAPEPELEGVCVIMCTSGTSGKPKGAMITEHGLKSNLIDIADYFKIDSSDTILIVRPLYHCAVLTGEFFIALHRGMNIFFFDEVYNPSRLLSCLEQRDITVVCGTPTLFYHLSAYAKRQKAKLKLRSAAISGECLSLNTARKIREAFPSVDFYHVYGLTEASPRVSYLPPELFDSCPESSGFMLRSVSMKIVSDNGSELPPGETGKLLIAGPNIMKGYYRDENRTVKAIKDGWLNTGDMAYISENGLLVIRGRADDMIIKAGMNIYPAEIESALKNSPLIDAAVAYGINYDVGQRIAVDIVPSHTGKDSTVRLLMAECARLLPSYQLPDEIHIVDNIRKNASGKVVRSKRYD